MIQVRWFWQLTANYAGVPTTRSARRIAHITSWLRTPPATPVGGWADVGTHLASTSYSYDFVINPPAFRIKRFDCLAIDPKLFPTVTPLGFFEVGSAALQS